MATCKATGRNLSFGVGNPYVTQVLHIATRELLHGTQNGRWYSEHDLQVVRGMFELLVTLTDFNPLKDLRIVSLIRLNQLNGIIILAGFSAAEKLGFSTTCEGETFGMDIGMPNKQRE